MYGDGSQASVLTTAGIDNPKAFVVTYADLESSIKAVERLHQSFPSVPIYARAVDVTHYLDLMVHGAQGVIQDERETSFRLTSTLLKDLGMQSTQINQVNEALRSEMEAKDSAFLTQIKRVENKKVDLEWENDAMSAIKNRMNAISGSAARQLVKFVSNNRRVVINDSGMETMVMDSQSFGFDDQSLAAPPLAGERRVNEKQTEDIGAVDVEDIAVENLGVTVCILPPKDKKSG